MRITRRFILLSATALAWTAAVLGGASRVFTYEAAAGTPAEPPLTRPKVAIPGVTVRADVDGEAARRFGAATSGQALLYTADGRLLFSGGITESRGHEGDNAGRSAIAALVLGAEPTKLATSPVYGCPLFEG